MHIRFGDKKKTKFIANVTLSIIWPHLCKIYLDISASLMNVWKCFLSYFATQLNPFCPIGTAAVMNCLKDVISRHDKVSTIYLDSQCKWEIYYCFQHHLFFDVGIPYLYSITFHISKLNIWPYVPIHKCLQNGNCLSFSWLLNCLKRNCWSFWFSWN